MRFSLATLPLWFILACTAPPQVAEQGSLDFDGPLGSAAPNLTADQDGRLILTWLETDSAGTSSLRFAVRGDEGWSPGTIVQSPDLFVNWADFPSLTVTAEGSWVAHFLEKTASSPYAYHAMVTISDDAGQTWSTPEPVHDDRSDTEHGFVASAANGSGGADLVWLDGRAITGEGRGSMQGAMSVRTRHLGGSGERGPEILLDDRTCECCQTTMTRTSGGLVVAYRDRSEGEIRDIAVVREENGGWTAPVIVAEDGWEHRACPVNGPALAADGELVTLVWYTGVSPTPHVYVVQSSDGGRTWGERLQVDERMTYGRVDLVSLGAGEADGNDFGTFAIAWLEADPAREAEGGALWRVRRVEANGELDEPVDIASVNRARVSGFPRLVVVDEGLFLANTATDSTGSRRVQVRRVVLPAP